MYTGPSADMIRTTFIIVSKDWYANRAAIDVMQKALGTYISEHPDAKMRCSDWNIRQRGLHENLE